MHCCLAPGCTRPQQVAWEEHQNDGEKNEDNLSVSDENASIASRHCIMAMAGELPNDESQLPESVKSRHISAIFKGIPVRHVVAFNPS